MKRLFSVVSLTIALAFAITPATATSKAPDKVPGQYIVVFNDSVQDVESKVNALAAQHGLSVQRTYAHALKGFAAKIPEARLAKLQADPDVAYVEQDQVFQTFSEVPTGVDRMEVDKKLSLSNQSVNYDARVDIAILDTGIASHPDLNIHKSVNCSGGSPMRGSCKESSATDGNGHGTHVAGTAAAKDDGQGVVGVAPGARLWGIKVLSDQGSGYTSWIIAGIDYVTKNADHIEVANMSLGCECYSKAQDDAITRSTDAGVVYVVAAGNSAKDASTFSPANHPQVIAVSAVADFDGKAGGKGAATCRADQDDTLADFSNYGSTVDIAAPGVCIKSTWPTALDPSGYKIISGTSMASPHAAGAAALYIVEKGIPKNNKRWGTVRSGLQSEGWSVAPGNSCGFTNEKGSTERMLMLASCDIAQ